MLSAYLPALSGLLPSRIRSYLGVLGPSDKTFSSTLNGVSQGRGKYWALSVDQCAICAKDAAFNIGIASSPDSNMIALASSSSSIRSTHQSVAKDDGPPTFPITTPYRTSCGHDYCYFCLSERMIWAAVSDNSGSSGGEGWACLRCESIVKSCARVEGEAEHADEMGSQDGLSENGSGIVVVDDP
jgi:peroxin-2